MNVAALWCMPAETDVVEQHSVAAGKSVKIYVDWDSDMRLRSDRETEMLSVFSSSVSRHVNSCLVDQHAEAFYPCTQYS
jgi:hypothetical protein